jgi:hypothetical protein
MLKLAAVAVFAMSLAQDEKIENPQYKIWSQFKAGSWVKHKMEMEQGGQKVEMEVTATLLEVKPESLTIERKQTMNMGGRVMELPVQKQQVDAKVTKEKAGNVKFTETEEEITVADKKLKCKLADMDIDSGGKKMKGKTWFHPDIPGGMAQGEFTAAELPKPMKMVAVAWEKK